MRAITPGARKVRACDGLPHGVEAAWWDCLVVVRGPLAEVVRALSERLKGARFHVSCASPEVEGGSRRVTLTAVRNRISILIEAATGDVSVWGGLAGGAGRVPAGSTALAFSGAVDDTPDASASRRLPVDALDCPPAGL